jgi:hypothetical protein
MRWWLGWIGSGEPSMTVWGMILVGMPNKEVFQPTRFQHLCSGSVEFRLESLGYWEPADTI